MVNREQLQGRWREVAGRLKEHWGQLTDSDLQRAEGSAEQLVGVVQERTGATRNEVERFIDNILSGDFGEQLSQKAEQYADAAQHMASETADYMRQQYERAAACSGDYSAKLAHSVRSRPAESLAIAFGLGIAAGALLFVRKRH